jgi:polygalacturonase
MPIKFFSKAFQSSDSIRSADNITNVKEFGAVGNGIIDDSTSIQNAIDHAASIGGGTVFFPNGTYLVKNNIILRNKVNLLGLKGNSQLMFDDTFVGTKPNNPNKVYHPVMWNEHNQRTYNQATADSFAIRDLIFTKSTTSADLKVIIFLSNTNGVFIDGCQFDMSGTVDSLALYVFSCNYNLTLQNNTFTNLTGTDKGGGIWICNLTDAPNETNKTYNININNNDFIINSGDESLGIYGRDGIVKSVNITNNKFVTLKCEAAAQSKVLAIFGRTSNTGIEGAGVENVIISNNIFEIEEIEAGVITIGGTISNTDIIKNILISSNIIKFKTDITNSLAVGILGNDLGIAENIKVCNNIISNVGDKPFKYGIYKMWDVEGNEVSGQYSQAIIADCKNVFNNNLYGNTYRGGSAIRNSSFLSNNIIQNCLRGILINSIGTYTIQNNKIDLPDDPSAIGIQITTSPSKDIITDNIINTTNSGSVAFYFSIGTITLLNNMKFGNGRYLDGRVILALSQGNRIDDFGFDTFYPGRIIDNEIQDALPVGHICWDSTESPVTGWKKIALGNGANKWQQVNL